MFITLQDTPIILDPFELATDEGWAISNGIAYHSICFAGVITLKNIAVEAGKTYVINYEVKSYVSGVVYPIIGGVSGTPVGSIGKKQDTIVVPEGATDLTVKFYSNGELGVSYMNFYPVLENPDNAVTVAFNSANNRWTTTYSWHPQFMLKFINDLYSWNEGKLWKHNVNETRNLFYDVQSYSEIEIIFNVNPTAVKNLYSMRVNGNLAWDVTDIYIRPIVGKEDGQRSWIKKGNFTVYNGQFMADFLRDATDPRFTEELDALFNGANLQGCTASIILRADNTVEVRLVSVDIIGALQEYTFG